MASIFDELSNFAKTAAKPRLEATYIPTGLYLFTFSDLEPKKNKDQSKDMIQFTFKIAEEGVKSIPDTSGKTVTVKKGEFSVRSNAILTPSDKMDHEACLRQLFEPWASAYDDTDADYENFKKAISQGPDVLKAALTGKTVYLAVEYKKGEQFPQDTRILTKKAFEMRKIQANG